MYTYLVGTTTPAATYSDNAGTPNTNPIVLNADGECDLYLDDSVSYRLVLKNSDGVTQFDEDRIQSISSAQLASLAATASATAADVVTTVAARDSAQAARDAALIQAGVYATAHTVKVLNMKQNALTSKAMLDPKYAAELLKKQIAPTQYKRGALESLKKNIAPSTIPVQDKK